MENDDGGPVRRVVTTSKGEELEVRGHPLGRASSWTRGHSHGPNQISPRYQRCSACRWTEITVVRREDGRYTLISEGLTSIEGEIPYARVSVAENADEAVRRLHRLDRRGVVNPPQPFLPKVARKALLEAARADDEIAECMRGRGYRC